MCYLAEQPCGLLTKFNQKFISQSAEGKSDAQEWVDYHQKSNVKFGALTGPTSSLIGQLVLIGSVVLGLLNEAITLVRPLTLVLILLFA